ncbi:Bypass of stop codon protein [Lachnellula occidentalis]|uniref:Bypass of stop codon protein n=1 Tax=Lachnellula occidentalis TaxID=215460 RepID=A0A8H8UCA4_9HELO|nr:Bypass of stop codon protein [Lachnellula occidentalis]
MVSDTPGDGYLLSTVMPTLHDEAEQPLMGGGPNHDISQMESLKTADGKRDYRAIARIVGCCVSAASIGWHDGCIGALIPYLQLYYSDVTDEKVSLVFIGSFTGYSLASLLNVAMSSRLALGRLIILGATIQAVASAIITLRPPFIAIAACYVMAGFGLALQDTQLNTYVARLPGAATKLGIVHAAYGVGALLSPTIATLLMQANVPPPSFYFTNLAWCVVTPTGERDEGIASLKTVVSSRAVWAALLFTTLYCGTESGEAGWIVSFLMRERDGGAASGYASAAFYCGLTSSRVMLLPLTAYITEKRAVAIYVVIALAMQVVIWTSMLFIVDFIAIATCGFVMGPIYPITVSLVTQATPHGYHPGALSLLACLGQSGGALFPFVVGSLADRYGIKVLQPVLVTLFILMILLWQLMPPPKLGLRLAPKTASNEEDVDPNDHES